MTWPRSIERYVWVLTGMTAVLDWGWWFVIILLVATVLATYNDAWSKEHAG